MRDEGPAVHLSVRQTTIRDLSVASGVDVAEWTGSQDGREGYVEDGKEGGSAIETGKRGTELTIE